MIIHVRIPDQFLNTTRAKHRQVPVNFAAQQLNAMKAPASHRQTRTAARGIGKQPPNRKSRCTDAPANSRLRTLRLL